jgi:signal transduction histidine kinase
VDRFPGLVDLACHDVRTPLATIGGFAKTLIRSGGLSERDARFVGMIDDAATQIVQLLDQLGLASRIAGDRYEPALAEADTLELAAGSRDDRVHAGGDGVTVETDVETVRRSLAALATAALKWGVIEQVTWTVAGRELSLAPVTADAAPVLDGSSPRDLGALVARMAIEGLGGTVTVGGGTLRVAL